MKKTATWLIAITILVSSQHAESAKKKKREKLPTPIETSKVLKKDFSEKVSLFGNVHAGRSATVRAEVEGSITSFRKDVGNRIKKGEAVARIDSNRYSIAVEEAKGSKQSAQASLEQAELEYKRTKTLFEKGIASRELLDSKRVARNMAKAELTSKNASLLEAKRNFGLTNIKAPYTGYIAKKHLQKGDWVQAGKEVFDIVDLSSVYILVALPEKDIARVPINSPAKIWLDAYPKTMFNGKVTRISPRTSKEDRGFQMRIDFKDKKRIARDGLFARVEIIPNKRTVLMVPKDAVIERGPQKIVFKINSGVAHKVAVSVKDQMGSMLEVEGKLTEGDEVAVTGNEMLREGAKVSVLPRR